MKRYYLITFSWTAGELSKVEEYKVFEDAKEPLREIVNVNILQRDIDSWISDQIVEIWRSECSSSFKCEDGLFRIVVTSDYPEKSKAWRHNSHNLIEVLCATIIEAERDIKINDVLS